MPDYIARWLTGHANPLSTLTPGVPTQDLKPGLRATSSTAFKVSFHIGSAPVPKAAARAYPTARRRAPGRARSRSRPPT